MSMSEVLKLRQERAGLIAQARAVIEAAEGEKRDLSGEEQVRYDALWSDIENRGRRADRLERQLQMEAELGQPAGRASRPEPERGGEGPKSRRATPEYARAFEGFLRTGRAGGALEQRDLQAGIDTQGGYLVPDQFVDELIKGLDSAVFLRQWARTFQVTTADDLGVPTLTADPADPVWTSELATGDEGTSLRFGQRHLRPHPLAKRLKESRTLLRKAPQVEALVRERLTYRFAVVMENAYLTGDGSGKPLGLFTASNDGIPTSRDVSTGNEATAMTFDGLVEAKYALKSGYWARARWLFHPSGAKQLVKIQDGEKRYLWRESVRAGEPDTLLGLPVFQSDFVPSTFTTGLYVGILGDFANYWIVDALDMELQRLDELYSETNQVGFIGRMESDGMPVLAEAFVRVKLA